MRRMDKVVGTHGITGLSRSQVSVTTKGLVTPAESVYDQPDAQSVGAQYYQAIDALTDEPYEAVRGHRGGRPMPR